MLSMPTSPYFCFYATWGNQNCKFGARSYLFSENSFLNENIKMYSKFRAYLC